MSILDGLTPKQLNYVHAIRDECRRRNLPLQALIIALEVVLVESGIRMYANANNPESLTLPHDLVGDDHGSVGLFQQQVGGAVNSTANWGTTRELMNPTISASKFFAALVTFNWQAMRTGEAAQEVQGSAFPDRYQMQEATARQLAAAVWTVPEPLTEDDSMRMVQSDKGSQAVLIDGPRTYLMQNGDRDQYALAGVSMRTIPDSQYQLLRKRAHPLSSGF